VLSQKAELNLIREATASMGFDATLLGFFEES